MGKTVVRTEAAPAPFQGAPYSQAIVAGGFVFVSGQVALEPGHTELMGGTIGEQTEQVFANLRAILEAAGSGLDKLVKTTVFLQNLADFAGMNEVYTKHVGRPAAGARHVRSGRSACGRTRRDRGRRAGLIVRAGTISVPCGPRRSSPRTRTPTSTRSRRCSPCAASIRGRSSASPARSTATSGSCAVSTPTSWSSSRHRGSSSTPSAG